MRYSVDALPLLTVWTNLAAERSGYVVGIEPGTNYPFNRRLERKAGRLQKLGPGATKAFELTYTLLNDPEAIEHVSDSIREISDGFAAEIVPDPPTVE